jgi:hypothetical protein
MSIGLMSAEPIILEIGAGILGLGMVLITGGLVGILVARRQYGAVFPLGLILAAVALLLWWEPLIRVVVSFPLLLIGYTWLFAWCRASQHRSVWGPSHRLREPPGQRSIARRVACATQPERSQKRVAKLEETGAG